MSFVRDSGYSIFLKIDNSIRRLRYYDLKLFKVRNFLIEDQRFTHMGLRIEGGFVGEHDRSTGEPIPDSPYSF